jgi:chemotaxis family two-component system sensor kinase Cph1
MNEENVDVISSDSIREDFPDLPQEARLACGTLATKISDDVVTFLFRTEFVDTIIWGGDPRKQLDRANLNGRINPRKSFAAWEEKIRGRALPWEDYEIEGFRRLKDLIFEKMQRSKAP